VNTQPPSILVGTRNRTVCVRVEGRGSFLNSTGLKEFAREMTNRGFREFVLDLKECPVMDSTFMGTMAGIALRLREIGQGELRVTNLNERNRDLLANLGLDQLFTMEGPGGSEEGPAGAPVVTPVVPQTPLEAQPVDKAEQAQTMIEAHEACIEANPANAAKFKDVLEYLKQDLHLVGKA
jgi:anti-sigma B factor antagonist